jgi:hypothetical protein
MSNHTLLTIGAFLILTTILLGFYRLLASTGDDLTDSQDMILATTLSESYMELAQGLAFDAISDTMHVGATSPSVLTPPNHLGPEDTTETSIAAFNDFDDFNGLVIERSAAGSTNRYKTAFKVSYVDPSNLDVISTTQTFVKRLDLKTWRSYPPPTSGMRMDTLRMSICQGYFHFD